VTVEGLVGTVVNNTIGSKALGSVGTLLPNTMAKILDRVSDEPTKANELGELCLKGPQLMKGFYRDEGTSKKVIDDEGWFHTGDLAYYDPHGHFYIVGPMKDQIKVKGFKVIASCRLSTGTLALISKIT
jgi:long-subunit acyl-CoA synthetase (AMP-forming)